MQINFNFTTVQKFKKNAVRRPASAVRARVLCTPLEKLNRVFLTMFNFQAGKYIRTVPYRRL